MHIDLFYDPIKFCHVGGIFGFHLHRLARIMAAPNLMKHAADVDHAKIEWYTKSYQLIANFHI